MFVVNCRVQCFLCVLLAILGWPAIAVGAPLGPSWGSQAVVDLYGTSSGVTGSTDRGTLVLQEKRFPLVVYLVCSGGAAALRSVEWRNGVRQDQPMFPTSYYTTHIRLAANGDRVAVLWSEGSSGGTGYTTVKFSLRNGGVWSEPEIVTQGVYPSSDLSFTPEGTPMVAVALMETNKSVVQWCVRGQNGWSVTELVTVPLNISSCHVMIDFRGVPTVAWRAYSRFSGAPPATIQYAQREQQVWTIRDLPNAALIESLFPGPDGKPCVITRRTDQSAAEFRSLGVAADVPITITTQAGPVACATAMPDGTIFAIRGDSLIVRWAGTWSEAPCPWTHGLAAAADGTLHALAENNSMINYWTLLPTELPTLHSLSTYAEGSALLHDVVMHPDGRPRIFGWLGENWIFSKSGTSWNSSRTLFQNHFPLHAYDRAGRIHAFSPESGQYGVEQPDGSMNISSLPVSVTSSSSSSVYAFLLDRNDVPHAGFYTDLGTPDVAVRYAVKIGTEWTVETVTAGETADQHCALALDPTGQPWMFTSGGLFRRTRTGWLREFQTSQASFPGIGISSDGTVHAVFRDAVGWRSLTGKNGTYQIDSFDSYRIYNTIPSFAMAGDRPLLVYGQEVDFFPHREAIVLAEKVNGAWRQQRLTPRTWTGRVGNKLDLVTTADGRWTVAGLLWEQQSNLRKGVLFVCEGELAKFDSKSQPIVHSIKPGGGNRFQFEMSMGPFLAPLELQTSDSLVSWTPVLDLGPTFRIRHGAEGLVVRGDPFRTCIVYEAPTGKPAWFVRLAGTSVGD